MYVDDYLKSNIPYHPEPFNHFSSSLAPNITSSNLSGSQGLKCIISKRKGLIIDDSDDEDPIDGKPKKRRFVIQDSDDDDAVPVAVFFLPDGIFH